MQTNVTVALLLFVASPAYAAGRSEAKPNVVVILVDAMRARNLGVYGYARPTTPNLDRFAAGAVVFDDAISQAAWTPASMGALFTALDPSVLECRGMPHCGSGEVWLAPEVDTVAEQFRSAGYQTVALMKTWALPEDAGYPQGFDRYEIVQRGVNVAAGESARILTDAALAYLAERHDSPFLLYLHYMDTHAPYRAPAPYYDRFSPGYTGPLTGEVEEMTRFITRGVVPTPVEVQRLVALYDGEIAYWDSQFARIDKALASAKLDRNTIVVVTADHGEGFYEHGQLSHGHLWQENIHVPLILRVPGVKPRRVEGWVQQNAIGPTLAELAGVPPGRAWQAGSLAYAVRGGPLVPEPVYSQFRGLRMLIEPSGMKLISGEGTNHVFDLKADPDERNDLTTTRPDDVTRLRAELKARRARNAALEATLPKPSDPIAEDAERDAQLKALGYTE